MGRGEGMDHVMPVQASGHLSVHCPIHSLASKGWALALHCLSFVGAEDKAIRVRHENNLNRM